MSARKSHLTVGWCWRADADGDPAEYGIYGHVSDAEAIRLAAAYECCSEADLAGATVTRFWQRAVPCHPTYAASCACGGDCPGHRMERAKGPGPGAGPYTWVRVEVP